MDGGGVGEKGKKWGRQYWSGQRLIRGNVGGERVSQRKESGKTRIFLWSEVERLGRNLTKTFMEERQSILIEKVAGGFRWADQHTNYP